MATHNWYVIKTKPRQELRACKELRNQGFEVFLPLWPVEKIRHGQNVLAEEPLFASYLFISLNTVDSNWRVLRSTRGVSRLLSFGEVPAIVPDPIIFFLKQRTDPATAQVRRYLQPQDQILIVEGPFRNLAALFLEYDGEKRAFLLLELLGQVQKMSFPLELLRLNN